MHNLSIQAYGVWPSPKSIHLDNFHRTHFPQNEILAVLEAHTGSKLTVEEVYADKLHGEGAEVGKGYGGQYTIMTWV